jgi:hypothetical protein
MLGSALSAPLMLSRRVHRSIAPSRSGSPARQLVSALQSDELLNVLPCLRRRRETDQGFPERD